MFHIDESNALERLFPLSPEDSTAAGDKRRAARATFKGSLAGFFYRRQMTLKKAEEILGPVDSWFGPGKNCVTFASALLDGGFCPEALEPRLRWGLYYGPAVDYGRWGEVPPLECGGRNTAWIETNAGFLIHAHRFTYDDSEPYIYIGKGLGEYS